MRIVQIEIDLLPGESLLPVLSDGSAYLVRDGVWFQSSDPDLSGREKAQVLRGFLGASLAALDARIAEYDAKLAGLRADAAREAHPAGKGVAA